MTISTYLFRSRKNKGLFLIVSIALGIMGAGSSVVKASAGSSAIPQQAIIVSATVDQYLAVYKGSDGNVSAETNVGNNYFVDGNICVIDY